jgi:hypothetical protein
MSDDWARAQALRAKAKSTEFPAEHAALIAKAEELERKIGPGTCLECGQDHGKKTDPITGFMAVNVRTVSHPTEPGFFWVEVDIVEQGFQYE